MAEHTRTQHLASIRRFCAQHPQALLFDEPGEVILDVYSSKTLPLDVPKLASVEERANLKESGRPYLVLQYEGGRQLALADVGIAFAPDVRNTGPLGELPDVVCFRDLATLLVRLKHDLYGHPDREPTRDTLRLLLTCVALLDGARNQGFDVGKEERELEIHLAELEKRAPRVPTSP